MDSGSQFAVMTSPPQEEKVVGEGGGSSLGILRRKCDNDKNLQNASCLSPSPTLSSSQQQQQQQQQQQPRPLLSPNLGLVECSVSLSSHYQWLSVLEKMSYDVERSETEVRIQFHGSDYVGQVDEAGNLCGRGSMAFYDGSLYEGEWQNSIRHGLGIFCYPDKATVYHGQYQKGKKQGFGVQCYPNGDTYEGEWSLGVRNGWGVLHSPSLSLPLSTPTPTTPTVTPSYSYSHSHHTYSYHYYGFWKADKKHLAGLVVDSNRRRITLEVWDNDGKLQCSSDNLLLLLPTTTTTPQGWAEILGGKMNVFREKVESGEWKLVELIELCGGVRVRKELSFGFGVYVGEVNPQKKDELSGWGTMTFNDGSHYEGDWKANQRHGLGTFHYTDGSSYHGEYKDNKKNGYGVQTYHTSSSSSSSSSFSLFGGIGSGGETYSGSWLEGSRHGWGVLTQKTTGWILEGQWKEDKKVGVGIRRLPFSEYSSTSSYSSSSPSSSSPSAPTLPSSSTSTLPTLTGTTPSRHNAPVIITTTTPNNSEPHFTLELRDNNGEITRSKTFFLSDPVCERPIWKAMLQGNSKLLREQVEAGDFFILEWLSDARRRSSLLESTSPVQSPTPASPSSSTTSSTYATGSMAPTGSSLPTQGASSVTSSSRLTNIFLSSLPTGFSGGYSSELQLSEGHLHSGSQSPLGSQQEQYQQEQHAGCDLGGGPGTGAGAGGEHPSQVVVKQGWLYKLDRQGKTWNRRFFTLKLNHTLLYYPKEPTSVGQMPAGVIELRKFALRLLEGKDREVSLSDSTGGSGGGGGLVGGLGLSGSSGNNTLSRRRRHKYVFELWHPESRSYQLGVASTLEREEWYFALRRFCQSSNS